MSKKNRERRASQAAHATARAAFPKLDPHWPVLGLALAGVLLTAYLAWVHVAGAQAAFCTQGSGCDVVQQSQWSSFLGIPTALWGLGLYAIVALVALLPSPKVKRWRRLFALASFGVAFSVFLTIVAAVALKAFCFWCLMSLALLVAILVVTLVKRPPNAFPETKGRWLLNHAFVIVPLIAVIGLAQAGVFARPADPRLAALAAHLRDSGAKFYGASWCKHCRDQKELFGRAADDLPFVECSPNGPNGKLAYECAAAGVTAFPTWVIRGRHENRVVQPEELARLSRFAWNAPQWSEPKRGEKKD